MEFSAPCYTELFTHSFQQVNSKSRTKNLHMPPQRRKMTPPPMSAATQNYISSCKHATIAGVRTSGEKGKRVERMRDNKYMMNRQASVGTCTVWRLTISQLRQVKQRGSPITIPVLPMMGASRKMSERRRFTGSYGESSKKSLPV